MTNDSSVWRIRIFRLFLAVDYRAVPVCLPLFSNVDVGLQLLKAVSLGDVWRGKKQELDDGTFEKLR